MPRESSFDKARRYLLEARLRITRVDGTFVEATCRSDGAVVYRLGHSQGRWCCPAVSVDCSHVRALRLVVVVSPSG